jgi:hypothetical protein
LQEVLQEHRLQTLRRFEIGAQSFDEAINL